MANLSVSSETAALGPHWAAEEAAWQRGCRVVAGCDEAGRGPLAGPVVAAAVILPAGCELPGLNDSKQLGAAMRQALYQRIRVTATAVGVGVVDSREIDRLNILRASWLAICLALEDLGLACDHVLLDGHATIPDLDLPQEALIKGDARCMSIAAASIIAKVTRDCIMTKLARLHPGYGFEAHKGYHCSRHLEALQALGPSPIHRTSFAPVRALLPEPPPLPPARCRGADPAQLRLFDDV